jgi:hypothetical protein
LKAASVHELKRELKNCSQSELLELCLSLTKFKKENKELITYLLYEAPDEAAYIESVKREIDEQFEGINKQTNYLVKKGVRKILKVAKKYIRYSKKKETETEVLLYFCLKLKTMSPTYTQNTILVNTYIRQLALIQKIILTLNEDLQYDYRLEIEQLNEL